MSLIISQYWVGEGGSCWLLGRRCSSAQRYVLCWWDTQTAGLLVSRPSHLEVELNDKNLICAPRKKLSKLLPKSLTIFRTQLYTNGTKENGQSSRACIKLEEQVQIIQVFHNHFFFYFPKIKCFRFGLVWFL